MGIQRKKIYEFTYQIIKEAGEDVLGVTEKILFTLYENLWEIYRNPEKKCTAAENMLKIYFPKISCHFPGKSNSNRAPFISKTSRNTLAYAANTPFKRNHRRSHSEQNTTNSGKQ